MLDPLYNAIGWLLALFYSLIPNLGIAIVLLTFTIMLLLYPLTAKQARSMIRMQMVQPEIKRLQAKYKNDRAKLNEEMMRFYQENKINPLAGCLPLLVQMPIFFALFHVLRNAYKSVPETSQLYKALCTVPGTDRVLTVQQCGSGNFDGVPVHEKFLGIDLSVSAPNQLGTWASFMAFALVVLVMFTGYMQSRQAQKRTPAINKQMALITKVLPVFFGFISLNFPSGLVLYFFVSNVWRLGQQEVIFRRFGTASAPKHRSLAPPRQTDVVDVASRDRTGDDEEAGGEQPAEPAARKTGGGRAPVPKAPKSGGGSAGNGSGKPVVPPQSRGGGLRGLFQLPPPPGEVPPPRPAAKPSPPGRSGGSATSASTARPGQAGRRTSKKKKR